MSLPKSECTDSRVWKEAKCPDGYKAKHISEVRVGDIVLHPDGYDRTVCAENLTRDPFMGLSLFGSSHKSGLEPVFVKLSPSPRATT
ncbi:hypothetical protein GCM10007853_17440 [Algimonas ampicilliniresistens]|uniref:Uncharacterized protein n=1 Tax=Algimonas ampicilliniresistens TaxID=1298735 RepID=A0ABQ5VB17_9PROT|nr:hypothetical protein [Algimonas ampicilliniresistens]GLQ23870.1 hypothetical protein GCM10007853_17440 [Algimonas ampicilliniresistens]